MAVLFFGDIKVQRYLDLIEIYLLSKKHIAMTKLHIRYTFKNPLLNQLSQSEDLPTNISSPHVDTKADDNEINPITEKKFSPTLL